MAPTKTFIDLRGEYMPPVYDQGKMMSCTAHAVAGAFEFQTMRLHRQSLFSPSRLFLWYNARKAITTPTGSPDPQAVKKNIGTYIRDAIKSLKDKGVCSEEDWSYEVGEYNTKTLRFLNGAKAAMTPPKLAWNHALGHLATGETARKHASRLLATGTSYHRLNATETNIQPLKECLSKGHPVIFGMKTYGLLRGSAINDSGEGLREARHSLLAVGYIERDEPKYNVIIVRNSWSERFGQKGYFYMPYPYLKLCYDFWILNLPQKIN
ncbi:hypothetical protein TRIATDRAFT_214553 [Trichoderma atroviride IMI 206040]|uniref:Peptidase C1A papain C-terminal domain-containing protein n=1 Tax=Hypocrea atroviridis (strain ATCC 20476 / IMI 206040) TaxID=452589 RepID=G9NKU3_HYPAI|nr:uncharacterized protein TRIATDRAFT_214553 [Trichoderma atroviride IMI 206040]EHK48515.1 hypothetical protein TRIATDRAFT_214553 [Trichoderma atroviride IMI 206040]